MRSIQYIDAQGVFIGSYQEGMPCEVPGATVAPADADGFHGMDGMRWNGSAWVEHMPPPDSCTRLQGLLALGMERAWQLEQMVLNLDVIRPDLSDAAVWEIQTTYRNAQTWHRLHPFVDLIRDMFGMSETERDDLIRLAVTLAN